VAAARADRPPKIDGKLLEPCWTKALTIRHFVSQKGEAFEQEWTTAHILYDDRALYFAFVCRHPDMTKLATRCTKRDQEVCVDDSVELFVDPGFTKSRYCHFMINSKAVYYDAFCSRGGKVFDASWNVDFPMATELATDRWTLEMALPFALMDLEPETGKTWGLNICRNMPGAATARMAQAFPTGEGFHVPEKFGALTGLDADLSRYCLGLEDVRLGGFLSADGKPVVRLCGAMRNRTGGEGEHLVQVDMVGAKAGRKFSGQTTVTSAQRALVPFAVPLPDAPAETYKLVIRVSGKNGVPVKMRWQDGSSPASCSELSLLHPSYRSAFYATMEDQTLRALVEVHAAASVLRELRYDYQLKGGGGKTWLTGKEAALPDGSGKVMVEFETAELPYATYLLDVRVLLRGKAVSRNSLRFHRYPPATSEVRIAHDGVLVVNGKRFFPIGLHGVGPYTVKTGELDAVASAGFNTVSATSTERGWLDELQKRRLKLFVYDDNIWSPWCMDDKKGLIPKALETVSQAKQHPAVLAYYFGDEPEIHPTWDLEGLVKGYRKMLEADPYHPVKPVVTSPGAYYQKVFRSFTDILGIDPYLYPKYDDPKRNSRRIKRVIAKVSAAVEIGGNRQPVWVDPQIFDMRAWMQRFHKNEIFPGRMPYLREQRYTVYRSIIEGAKGFLFWQWFHDYANPNLNPASWEMLRALAGEMGYLHDVLVSEEPPSASAASQDARISLKAFSRLGQLWLIATNDSSARIDAKIRLTNCATKALWVLSENRTVRLTPDGLADTFQPFDVHIYTAEKPARGSLVLEEMLRDPLFAEEPSKDKNPKNLCWEGNGAKISSSHVYCSFKDSPVFAIDGDVRTCWFTRRWGYHAGPVRPDDKPWVKRLKQTWRNDWVQVDFPGERTLSKIEIVSWLPRYYNDPINVLSDYAVEYLKDGKWLPLVKAEGNRQETIAHTFSPVTTKSIRVVVTKGLYIAELRAFAAK